MNRLPKPFMIIQLTQVLMWLIFTRRFCFHFSQVMPDMHLKNFSLLKKPMVGYALSPAYDLVATVLVNPTDKEELALTLNGKKRKINRKDFSEALGKAGIAKKQEENIFNKMKKSSKLWFEFINHSFLNREMKKDFKEIIRERLGRVMLVPLLVLFTNTLL